MPPTQAPTRLAFATLVASALVAGSFVIAGCCGDKKKDSSGDRGSSDVASGPATATAVGSADNKGVAADGLTHYPDERAEVGTVYTRSPVDFRQAADSSSDVVGHSEASIAVTKKARRQGFLLVDFPSDTPGQTKTGWLAQADVAPPMGPPAPPASNGRLPLRNLGPGHRILLPGAR